MDTDEKKQFDEELLGRISQVERGDDPAVRRMTGRDYALVGAIICVCLAAVAAGYFLG